MAKVVVQARIDPRILLMLTNHFNKSMFDVNHSRTVREALEHYVTLLQERGEMGDVPTFDEAVDQLKLKMVPINVRRAILNEDNMGTELVSDEDVDELLKKIEERKQSGEFDQSLQ